MVQEHGQSLSMAAHALRRLGAEVTTVAVYRVEGAADPEPVFGLIEQIAERRVHAVTFTGPGGTFRQTTQPTKPQIDIYAKLDLPLPKKIIEITLAST